MNDSTKDLTSRARVELAILSRAEAMTASRLRGRAGPQSPPDRVWCNKAAEVGESAKQGRCEWLLGLIRFGGHLPKGEYDVDHDGHEGQADAAELHG